MTNGGLLQGDGVTRTESQLQLASVAALCLTPYSRNIVNRNIHPRWHNVAINLTTYIGVKALLFDIQRQGATTESDTFGSWASHHVVSNAPESPHTMYHVMIEILAKLTILQTGYISGNGCT